jgi:hypothetical protein
VSDIEVLQFESCSRFHKLDLSWFSAFSSLKSIIIPASVEVIDFIVPWGRPGIPSLENVVFESGSKLREIKGSAFCGCNSLTSITLPASVQLIDGRSFQECAFSRIDFDPGNRFFHRVHAFVMDLLNTTIVRYFGSATEVSIADEIEILGPSCFSHCSLFRVLFREGSQLRSIESLAFSSCPHLASISIPSLVIALESYCFSDCNSLRSVSFAAASKLRRIESGVFMRCSELESITIPSSVEQIGESCFAECEKLSGITFPVDSSVASIQSGAFGRCSSLQSLVIPSSVEGIGWYCFEECTALLNLTFASPSHVRHLRDLPPNWTGLQAIPDSVEWVSFRPLRPFGSVPVLKFGSESRLESVRFYHELCLPTYFLHLSSGSLQMFRSKLEFDKQRVKSWKIEVQQALADGEVFRSQRLVDE